MKRLAFFSLVLFISTLACSLPLEQQHLYFIEHFSGKSRLMYFKSKNEVIDITPQEVDSIEGGGSLSPSGNFLAVDGIDGIYVINTKSLKVNKVTDFGYFPGWSLDERWLIFHFQEKESKAGADIYNDRVYAVNLDSGIVYTPDRLAENGDPSPSWLSTNSSLVYTSNTIENVSYTPNARRDGIYVYDIDRQQGHFLLKSDEFGYSSPFVSPDGQSILYIIAGDFDRSLVLSTIGSDLRRYKVIKNPEEAHGLPLWSQDSQYFILDSSIYDSNGNKLREINMDGWFINQMVWGDTTNTVYILRNRDALGSASAQLVSYNITSGKSDILYVTTNYTLLLPWR